MISIIVPIYKVEKYLKKCIESLINQTYKDVEIILVDDGSPDNCGIICDCYASKDARVLVIHQKNAGVSAARNAGLEAAHGEYIGFCDPDDFCNLEMFGDMLEAICHYNVDMAACGYNYYDENYHIDDTRIYPEKGDEIMSRVDIYSKLADMPPTIRHGVVTKLFKRSVIGDNRFDTALQSAEDADFLLDYISKISSAVFVHRPLYCNLVRDGSATHGALKVKELLSSFKVHDRMYQCTVREFPNLRSKSIAFLMDVSFLKYNEATAKNMDFIAITKMRKYIRRKALSAVFSKDIFWKTKIYYLMLWLRK